MKGLDEGMDSFVGFFQIFHIHFFSLQIFSLLDRDKQRQRTKKIVTSVFFLFFFVWVAQPLKNVSQTFTLTRKMNKLKCIRTTRDRGQRLRDSIADQPITFQLKISVFFVRNKGLCRSRRSGSN